MEESSETGRKDETSTLSERLPEKEAAVEKRIINVIIFFIFYS